MDYNTITVRTAQVKQRVDHDVKAIMNGKVGGTWKLSATAYLKVLIWYIWEDSILQQK
jgi:hypothetical protein